MAINSQPRGVRNNNPLNIRKSPDKFQGEVLRLDEREFKTFSSIKYGFRAAFCIIRTYIMHHALCTIEKIIRRWCPDDTADNYIKVVCHDTGLSPTEQLSFYNQGQMVSLVKAMARVETGYTFDLDLVIDAYRMSQNRNS